MGLSGRIVVGIAAVAFAAFAAVATAGLELIQPGVRVGKVRLGMTQSEVRGELGKPGVAWQRPGSFGRQTVEWQYDSSGYTIRFTGPAGRQRVSSVGTIDPRQRTPEGVGPGSLETRVQRAYGARLRCAKHQLRELTPAVTVVATNRRNCILVGPGGAETVFVSWVPPVGRYDGYVRPSRWPREARVLEVVVRRASFSPEAY